MRATVRNNVFQISISVRLTGFGLGLGSVCMLMSLQYVGLCIQRVVYSIWCMDLNALQYKIMDRRMDSSVN